jgi:Zn-dependent M28 family amino/carboxypeptidase
MRALILAACVSAAACTGPDPAPAELAAPGPLPAVQRTAIGELPEINGSALLAHTKVLSSDQFEGRAPGTKGEALTVSYLIDQFQRMGLKPGNTDGTFVQKVPLIGISSDPSPLRLKHASLELELQPDDEIVAITRRRVDTVSVEDVEVVFVGYGVVAPELDWDDYRAVDVSGKVVVMLSGAPVVADESGSPQADAKRPDAALAALGHWTTKFRAASERGAAGAFIVNESGPGPYPPGEAPWKREQLDLIDQEDAATAVLAFEGWLGMDPARRLLSLAGQDFDELKAQAGRRQFQAVPLGITSTMTLHTTLRTLQSQNVLARIEGRDPKLRGEHVVFMAHWDHLGVGEPVQGDAIYNGAIDNAIGVAGVLETARAFVRLSEPPRRSILFLAVTAEHQGQLGLRHYVANPVYRLERTAAVISVDTLNVHGRTRDIGVLGLEHSALEEYVREAAGEQGRIVRSAADLETPAHPLGAHRTLERKRVPALNPVPGTEYLGKPVESGERLRTSVAEGPGTPLDSVGPQWDLSGAREDLKVFFAVGYRVAEADEPPALRPEAGPEPREAEPASRK